MSDRRQPGSDPLEGRTVLVCVTGGIAAYKSCTLVRLLVKAGARVQVAMTQAATRFVGPETFAALSGRPVLTSLWNQSGTVPHVLAAHEADVAVVAPATANTLAKIALGFADDAVSSTLVEIECPLIVAPAMHSGMFRAPATQENLTLLESHGARVVGPEVGELAAGDEGLGRMSEPDAIVEEIRAALGRGLDLAGRRILVTAGPTQEPIDPVRFIGNRSSGKMGIALATEAVARGAEVTMILGPVAERVPARIAVVPVETAAEMRQAVIREVPDTDVVVMAAAVADFRPASSAERKIKKEDGVPTIELERNPDILSEIASGARPRVLVGFAAETEDLEQAAAAKLEAKGVDLLVVNRVGASGTGFGSDTDEAGILGRDGWVDPVGSWTKRDLAREICDQVVKLLDS
jgi:phosphopantothenoylcysteine decarboxylase/phosphopantothenate--cysteine ligase